MRRQRGLGAIAAIIVLVLLASLAAGIVAVGTTQQLTSALDVQSARAQQAANAGIEMGLFRVLGTGGDWASLCPGTAGNSGSANATLDLTADTGFHVTVTAQCNEYNETTVDLSTGQSGTKTQVYQIEAVACPAAACPASGATVAAPGYVERTRVVIATTSS